MNNYQKTIKILQILNRSIHVGAHNGITASRLFQLAKRYRQFLVSAVWLDYKADQPELYDAPDIRKESTHDGCIDCEIKVTDTQEIKLIVVVYEADNWDGTRLNKRCQFSLVLPDIGDIDFTNVYNMAEQLLRFKAASQLKAETENRYIQEINQRMNEILEQHI